MEQVNLWWQSYQFVGNPSYVLARKLRALKGDLHRWNNEIFGHFYFFISRIVYQKSANLKERNPIIHEV